MIESNDKSSLFSMRGMSVLLNLYFMIVWILNLTLRRSRPYFLDHYFLFIHLSLVCISAYLFYKQFKREKDVYKKSFNDFFRQRKYLPYLGIWCVYLLVIVLKFPEKVIWLDEQAQYNYGSGLIPSNVARKALEQQQPPLDYALMGFASSLFGQTVLAVKFHAILFGSLFFTFLPNLLNSFLGKMKSSWLIVLLFMGSPILYTYFLEGRPIALALITGLIYFTNLIAFFRGRGGVLWVILSQSLFLISTSLQPQLFIFIALTGLAILAKENRERIRLLLIGFVGLLIRLPLDYIIYGYTDEMGVFSRSPWSTVEYLSSIIKKASYVLEQFGPLFYWLVLLVFIASLILSYLKKDRKFVVFWILPLGFISLYSLIWDFKVNATFQPRYVLTIVLFLSLPIGMIFKTWEESRFYSNMKLKVLSVILLLYGSVIFTKPLSTYNLNAERSRWDLAYNYLNQNVKGGDLVIPISFSLFGDARQTFHEGSIFYGNDLVKESLIKNYRDINWGVSNYTYFDRVRNYNENAKVRLFLMLDTQTHESWFSKYKFRFPFELKQYNGIDVLVFDFKKNLYETTKTVFEEFLRLGSLNERLAPIIESLILMEYKFGNLDDLKYYVSRYDRIRIKNYLNSRNNPVPKDEEKAKRMETFKNLIESKEKER